LATRTWTKLKTRGTMPVELASHSALLHGKYLVIFGGTGIPFGEAASNQLHVCHLPTLKWSHVSCSGDPPISIYGHTTSLCRNSLYVFGGTTGWEYNAEIHRLNLENNMWNSVTTYGQRPAGRYRHEVACFNNEIFVFGGGRSNQVSCTSVA
jgi:N-acetylneuraminic acid mutarotase